MEKTRRGLLEPDTKFFDLPARANAQYPLCGIEVQCTAKRINIFLQQSCGFSLRAPEETLDAQTNPVSLL